MNYYTFIPLAAFIIHFFTFIYILALKRKTSVNKAYLIFAALFAFMSLTSFIIWSPIKESSIVPIMKINSISWIMLGFIFLNFTYVFLNKPRDYIYYSTLAFSLGSYGTNLSTNLVISGYTKYYWGPFEVWGPLFPLVALLTFTLPFLYSFTLIYIKRRETKEENMKKQLLLVLQGTGAFIVISLVTDLIIPQIFKYHFISTITTGTVIQSLFIFRAVTKYNFLSIGVEEVAHDLFTNIGDGIILVDSNESIIQINEEARVLFYLQNMDILNLRISALFEKYDFDKSYKNYETVIHRSNGEQRTVSLSQASVKQYDVELGKLLIVRDITENKKAEKELQESKTKLENLAGELRQANTSLEQKVAERTRSLLRSNEHLQREIAERSRAEEDLADEKERLAVTLSSIGDGVITTDTTGRIVLLNTIAEQLTGWRQEEAVSKPLLETFHILDEKTRIPRKNPVEEVLQTNEIVTRARHTLLVAKDGTEQRIAETVAPIRDKDGGVIGVVLVFRDMTDQHRIEEELVKAERLESIGMLAGGIAHDFNNILTAIIGNISLAKMYASQDEKTATRLDNAEKASLRAQDLTQQLLTFSKGGTPVKRLASIKDIIKDSIDFSLRGSNVRCDLSFADDLWAADVDEGQISQVIHNLMINANQAMPDGGVIEVQAENATVDESTPEYRLALKLGHYVKIRITDQGLGIEEERLQKIFDPYFTTKKQGSGLGLFTSYSIIKKHDGYIDVQSELGVGTRFSIYLPASQKSITATTKDEEETVLGQGNVLVMEDEETLRDVMGTMLDHFGYEVEFARDGAEAIDAYQRAKASSQPFDVIIMDLTIPGGMGGKEAIAKIRAFDPDVKAIVASGYANDPIMGEYKQHGFCGCIAKPYKAKELNRILRQAIAGTNV